MPSLTRRLLPAAIALACLGLSACVVTPPRTQIVYRNPPPAPHAWRPAEHPYYLHAMSDLRMARAYLARPDYEPVASDERRAVAEIDAALDETPRGDRRRQEPVAGRAAGRQSARQRPLPQSDVAAGFGAPRRQPRRGRSWVRDLQHRIVHHIDEAKRATQQAVADALR